MSRLSATGRIKRTARTFRDWSRADRPEHWTHRQRAVSCLLLGAYCIVWFRTTTFADMSALSVAVHIGLLIGIGFVWALRTGRYARQARRRYMRAEFVKDVQNDVRHAVETVAAGATADGIHIGEVDGIDIQIETPTNDPYHYRTYIRIWGDFSQFPPKRLTSDWPDSTSATKE